MNKTKIFITTMLVAALAAGCSKEDTNGESTRDNVIRIFASPFQNGNGSKVIYDPTDVNQVDWVAGELISLGCGNHADDFDIEGEPGSFYIDIDGVSNPLTEDGTLYALYPARTDANRVQVTNNETTREILLDTLTIAIDGDDHHNSMMAFPMASCADYVVQSGVVADYELVFRHICAGFRVRLNGVNDELKALRIVALSEVATEDNFRFVVDLDDNNHKVTARWGKQGHGPVLPTGPLGDNEDDVVVGNFSEMNFIVDKSAILDGDHMDFCIPVTIQSFSALVIVGYDENGDVLFKKTTNFNTEREILINRMYTLPEINL